MTGYTAAVAENENYTLHEYAMRCARSFGACIDMRELPFDAPIPEKFEPEPRYKKELENSTAKYEAFLALSDEDKVAQLEQHYNKLVDEYSQLEKDENERRRVVLSRYEAMLDKVRKWKAPTPDHENLREFMISQLETSIKHDCGEYKPIIGEKEEWLNVQKHIDFLKTNMDLDAERLEKHLRYVDERNKWFSDLRKSLEDID